MLPKVSVIIPVYNCEKYIRECVESVLSQDYENLEVIVVDDGSTDATPNILKEFGQKIRYIHQANRGAAAALNEGIRFASGSLIAWLSADDLYLPGKIIAQVQKFQEDPSLGLVYTDWIMIDAEGREILTVQAPCPPEKAFVREMLKGNFINGSSVLIRRECFERAGYFDERLPADVDGDMWFRLLKHGYRFGHVPKLLLKYRWHPSNLSHNYRLMQTCKDKVRLKVIETFSAE
ncbi:MAG: glycosyltransferase family 2 protein, partial [Candidatus Methanomethylicaceae archaeon]